LSFGFDDCTLSHSSFYQQKLKKIKFKNCRLDEVDFTLADLTEAAFIECDLRNASFDNTILEKADFRTAYNYIINPEQNKIRKAKFAAAGISGLLQQYDIQIEP
jgi:uncharacterized protein YjbI with pentapeptide repeats